MRSQRLLAFLAVVLLAVLGAVDFESEDGTTGSAYLSSSKAQTLTGSTSSVGVLSSDRDSTRILLSVSGVDLSSRFIDNVSYSRATFEGAEYHDQVGAPRVPVIRKLVVVPDCESVSIRAVQGAETIIEDIVIEPASDIVVSESNVSGWEEVFVKDDDVYSADSYFPGRLAELKFVGSLRGQRLAFIEFYPVQFNPVKKQIKVIQDLQIVVATEGASSELIRDVGPFQNVLENITLNGRSVGSSFVTSPGPTDVLSTTAGEVCWCSGATWQATADSVISCQADYLMIVADELVSTATDSGLVDSLAQRRAVYNGFNVAVVRMSDIDDSPNITTTPVTIRSFIDTVYESVSAGHMGDGRLGYVLLVGDALNSQGETLIPLYYDYPQIGGAIVCDTYYSFLDGDPAVDRFPDIFLGRLSVDFDSSSWELSNVVDKIIEYEPLSPTAAWLDSILLVSGGDCGFFSFEGEDESCQNGAGFKNFFDAVIEAAIPETKNVSQRNVLLDGLSDFDFSEEAVQTVIDTGFFVTALFDHGNYFLLAGQEAGPGCYQVAHYDTLASARSTLFFLIGSHLGQLDYAGRVNPGEPCCPSTNQPQGCVDLNQPATPLDDCDVMAERLLVQPGGAIATLAYTRSTFVGDAQRELVNLFKAMYSENASTLGELLVAVKMLQPGSSGTVYNLALFGDPALSIVGQNLPNDGIDLAIGRSDIRPFSPTGYLKSNANIEIAVTIRNVGPNDATDIDIEIWNGVPESPGAQQIDNGIVLPLVAAYGSLTDTFVVDGVGVGLSDVYVTIDPDGLLSESTTGNNIASRRVNALPYQGDYPIKLTEQGQHSVLAADLHATPGNEIAFCTKSGLHCYSLSDTAALWRFSRGIPKAKSNPIAGTVYKDGLLQCLYEADPYVYVIDPRNDGTTLDSVFIDDPVPTYPGQAQALGDLIADDNSLELVTFNGLDLVAYDLANDSTLWAQDIGFIGPRGAIAIGDIDNDGGVEVVTRVNELFSAHDGASGDVESGWENIDIGGGPGDLALLILFDRDPPGQDGKLEILVNGFVGADTTLFLYDSGGNILWSQSVGPNSYASVGDLDDDEIPEIVLLSENRIQIRDSADGGVIREISVPIGSFSDTPLLVDLNGNGSLEIITVAEDIGVDTSFPIPPDTTLIRSYDELLNEFGPTFIFPGNLPGANNVLFSASPVIEDLDLDGSYEIAYVSPDSVLHVLEIGTQAGRNPWSQRYNNSMLTNVSERRLRGEYLEAVSLFNNVRITGDVTFDSMVYVDATARIRIDATDAEQAGVDTTKIEVNIRNKMEIVGTAENPVVFETDPSLGDSISWIGLVVDSLSGGGLIAFCEISNAETGVEAHDSLVIRDSKIMDCRVAVDSHEWLQLDRSNVLGYAEAGVRVSGGRADITAALFDFSTQQPLWMGPAVVVDSICLGASLDSCTIRKSNEGIWQFAPTHVANSDISLAKGFLPYPTGIWSTDSLWVDGSTIHAALGGINSFSFLSVDSSNVSGGFYGISNNSGNGYLNADTLSGGAGGIGLDVYADSVECKDSRITDGYYGVSTSSNRSILVLDDVYISNASIAGVSISDTATVEITDCLIETNDIGVEVYNSSNVTIRTCNIKDNTTDGIYCHNDSDILIEKSGISGSAIGILCYDYSDPQIRRGTVIENNGDGIRCDEHSHAVVESTVIDLNVVGISTDNRSDPNVGVAGGGATVGHNKIHHNSVYNIQNQSYPPGSPITIMAENNWWKGLPPNPSKFVGRVDTFPWIEAEPDVDPFEEPSFVFEAPVEIPRQDLPQVFQLSNNYPNPFNPDTRLNYDVPAPGGNVEIIVYNVRGQVVSKLVSEYKSPGRYVINWNGRNDRGANVATGVYFVRMHAPDFVQTQKLVLLK